MKHKIYKYITKLALEHQQAAANVLKETIVLGAPGSGHNHQAWPGGYIDHIAETMQIAEVQYSALSSIRPLPFSLESAMLVMFVHDLEKPWKQKGMSKKERAILKKDKINEFGFVLTDDEWNGVIYAEGEIDDYSPNKRMMGRLAAFCHCCDVLSARLWFDQPNIDRFNYLFLEMKLEELI